MMSRVVNMFSLRPSKHEGTGGATPSPKAASIDPRAATEAALHLPSLHRVEVEDTRWLTYRVFGRALAAGPTGVVLYFHGTPSCHIEAAVLAEHAEKQGVAVLSVDRPGIGGSTYQRRLSLTSFANYCNRLLDLLGVGRVIVVGCSGGGPYATAFAVLFPARARALGLLAPLAPTDWRRQRHRANLKSMGGFDKFQLAAARDPTALLGTPTLWLAHRALRYMAEKKPELLLEYVPKGMAAVDGDVMLHDPRIKGSFAAVLQHAYSGSGARGVVKDVNVLGRAWGLEACGVNCRTLIWQGSEDKSVPLTHAEWYASQIPGAKLVVLEGEGHVTLPVRHAALVLDSLLAAAEGRQLALAPSLPVLSPEKEKELLVRVSLDQEAEAQQVLKGGAELPPAGGEEGEDEGRGGRISLIGRGGGSGSQ